MGSASRRCGRARTVSQERYASATASRISRSSGWWLGEMMKRGASAALVRVDLRDDADLNLCAGLVEEWGERLWLGPLEDTEPALADWLTYGRLARIVLPPALYARRAELLPPPAIECASSSKLEAA